MVFPNKKSLHEEVVYTFAIIATDSTITAHSLYHPDLLSTRSSYDATRLLLKTTPFSP